MITQFLLKQKRTLKYSIPAQGVKKKKKKEDKVGVSK